MDFILSSKQRRLYFRPYLFRNKLLCLELDAAVTYKSGARCWWRSWLRHCATSRKVAGSIPDGVIGFFH